MILKSNPTGVDGLDRIAQVKIPVTDLAISTPWYCGLLDLRLWVEIVEDDRLRGVGLIDPRDRFNISLRDRTVCAGEPNLSGFDVVAFLPASRAVLEDMASRCDRLGITHNGIEETPGGPRFDVADPDGTVLRFYHFTQSTDGFIGLEMRDGAVVGTYVDPRTTIGVGERA